MTESSLPSHLLAQLGSIVESAKEEPLEVPPEERTRVSRTKAEAFAALDPFEREARAGASDEYLGQISITTQHQVRAWRRARGIQRVRGPKLTDLANASALNLLGDEMEDVVHRTDRSSVGGLFEPPEYVLRTPLRYSELTRCLRFLHTHLGADAELLAGAFGFRERDVRFALLIEDTHLDRHGTQCLRCGALTDPAYGPLCSARCKKEKP